MSAHRIVVATPAGYTGCGPTSEDRDCVLFAERVEVRRNAVEKRLRHLLGDVRGAPLAPVRLAEAMRYATLGGGKRFRPYLVIEAAALFGVTEQQALDTAAAIECIHCYSLVHDDLPAMDDDDLRRGRPTVHKAGVPTRTLYEAYLAEDQNLARVARWYEIPEGWVKQAVKFEIGLEAHA